MINKAITYNHVAAPHTPGEHDLWLNSQQLPFPIGDNDGRSMYMQLRLVISSG